MPDNANQGTSTAGAFFTVRHPNMATLRVQHNDQGGFNLFSEGVSGDGRMFTVNPMGGVWKLTTLLGVPDNTGFELKEDGSIVVYTE